MYLSIRMLLQSNFDMWESNFDMWEGKHTTHGKAPADRTIPLNVAHFACETCQNAQKNSCL
jgi:hypothetical protein